ncbi:MAG TPA: DNA oxidative demethylase AlkB [Pseudomonas xinjiangensis]|uniref:DNA oxidative demethylase AlkB n=2 Tax=root TaxID=1 RepID=A0A7V1BRE5_9GAMM|nr:DNA oxidative demethylase AlkB [Halopseudomonas xinjiangensis]HEC47493.1 DNA oxidative demethylase AlkB [Halopseudomonas xinjiangensis]
MAGTLDLFDDLPQEPERLAEGAWLLRGFALCDAAMLIDEIHRIANSSPFRHQVTPGGHSMSAAMTNCGGLGWVTDLQGYRYSVADPLTEHSWPEMPETFLQLAQRAAQAAEYHGFLPQSCLINRYETGARMSLHQDRDEQDLRAPIVSVSLGAPISFMFGGPKRADKPDRWKLEHGDVVVWGGASRLFYHGVAPLGKKADHPLTGAARYNLTFRKVY